jgi:probable phosphoglycerate mutase
LFLIRHAPHPLLDAVLVGRMAGAGLDEPGHRAAGEVAGALASRSPNAIHSSPQARARETAQPIARRTGIAVEVAEALDEIDLGEWTGRTFRELETDPGWRRWNSARGLARPPKGESMRELQDRVIGHLRAVSDDRPDGRVVMVSHAEVIRAALLYALDLPLDDFWRIAVAPASISTLVVRHGGMAVIRLNERPAS